MCVAGACRAIRPGQGVGGTGREPERTYAEYRGGEGGARRNGLEAVRFVTPNICTPGVERSWKRHPCHLRQARCTIAPRQALRRLRKSADLRPHPYNGLS